MHAIAMMFVVPHTIGWLVAAAIAAAMSLVAGINVATKGPIEDDVRTYTASAAAMGKGLAVVSVTDDNTVAIAGANVSVLGFVDESNINIGDAIGVVEEGEFLGPIGAAVSIGQFLITDGGGRLVPTSAAGDNVVAQALSSGSTANDYILAKVCQFTRGAGAPVTYPTVAGAIAVSPGVVGIDGAGALAMTLATPTTPAQDGIGLKVVALTAHAHTVTTATNKIQDDNATYDTVTYAHVGDFVELVSLNGVWQVVALRGATLSEA